MIHISRKAHAHHGWVIFAVLTAPLSECNQSSVLDPLDHANHFASLFKVRGAKELSKHVPLMVGRCGFVDADPSVVQVRAGEAICLLCPSDAADEDGSVGHGVDAVA